MKQLTIALSILLTISSISFGQRKKTILPESPKLIISIVIEDMRYDYINRYWDNFGDGGFKKLVQEGSFCRNANYNYMLTQTSAGFATIATGCEPVVHGIVADHWFMPLKNKSTSSVFNANYPPVGSEDEDATYSPANLLTTTFSDELKLFNYKQSKVIGISMNPESAILPIGHLGDAAYWFDEDSGNWISSSFYMDSLPTWVNTFNNKGFPDIYKEREWTPLLPELQYRVGAQAGNAKEIGFSSENKFSKKINAFLKKGSAYSSLKVTPYGINLTKDLAIAAIYDEALGKDEYTDYLSINFSNTAAVSQACGPNSIELEDLYVRLDRELEHFIQFVESEIGKDNILIYLTSDHGTAYNPNQLKENNIPAGEFSGERAVMLLGTYLNAMYDKGQWVSAYHNKQIYLNRSLIESADIPLAEFQKVVADFIIQFNGVANAITSSTLEQTNFTHGIFYYMQNSFNQKRSGDIIINLEPGWIEKGDYLTAANSANKYDRHVPLIWYGWKIKRSKINTEVQMKDIAPTLSNFLDIPYPNGCTGKVITELER